MPDKDLINMTSSSLAIAIPSSNQQQLSTSDEEVAAEADEPSDNCSCNLSRGKLHFQENLYKKHIVSPGRPHRVDSLLTRAIISDSEPHSADNNAVAQPSSIYTRVGFRVPRRGMSTTSTVSTASMPSTADLTSDAGDDSDSSSSELSSPSPRMVPVFALPLIRDSAALAVKTQSDDELHKSAVQSDPNEVTVALGRKRCITFACPNPVTRQASDIATAGKPKETAITVEEPAPVRRTTLKFACNVKDECKAPRRSGSPPPPSALSKPVHRSPVSASHLHPNGGHHRRDSASTVVDERQKAIACKPSPLVSSVSSASSIPRFYEFASSVDESVHSWMNAPQFPSRLLKVDCLLEKEKQIRKLSEEVEEDEADEEEEDNNDDDDDNLEFEDDDEEDDGYKEDEEDDEYEIWSDSDDEDYDNNHSDSDEEECDSDNERDVFVPKAGTAIPDRKVDRPSCCRNTSDSSLASVHDRKSGCSFQREKRTHVRPIRPSTPELPDSTDFVPGTFDEDKVLEDYYLSCIEDRKSMNKVFRPQDIDPSFPEGGDDDEDEDNEEAERPARRRRGSNVSVRSPRGSPAPNRRLRSPPPISRRGSRGMSPGKRRPSFTAKSPPPQNRTGRLRFDLQANRASLARSTSLPRHGVYRKKSLLTPASPKSKAIPFRKRSVLDIVKGLESKRMRRRENVYGRREYKAEAGEGVERMREIGIMGRERVGANPAPKWMMSF